MQEKKYGRNNTRTRACWMEGNPMTSSQKNVQVVSRQARNKLKEDFRIKCKKRKPNVETCFEPVLPSQLAMPSTGCSRETEGWGGEEIQLEVEAWIQVESGEREAQLLLASLPVTISATTIQSEVHVKNSHAASFCRLYIPVPAAYMPRQHKQNNTQSTATATVMFLNKEKKVPIFIQLNWSIPKSYAWICLLTDCLNITIHCHSKQAQNFSGAKFFNKCLVSKKSIMFKLSKT